MNKLTIYIFLLLVAIGTVISAAGQGTTGGNAGGDGYLNSLVFYNTDRPREALFVTRDGKIFPESSTERFFSVRSDGPFEIRLRLMNDWHLGDGSQDIITMNRGGDKLIEIGVELVAMNSNRQDHFGKNFSLHLLPVQYFRAVGEDLLLAEWGGGAFQGDFSLTCVLQLIKKIDMPLLTGRHNLLFEFSLVQK